MHARITAIGILCAVACGSPATESESAPVTEAPVESESARASATASGSATATPITASAAATPSCVRVRPCIEAFIEAAPAELAGPARTALVQLDASLADTSAREPACLAAIGSFRHDLEALEIETPEACR